MKKVWRIAAYEYRRHVFRKRFLLVVFGLPFFFVLVMTVGVIIAVTQTDLAPLGYVDQADLLTDVPPVSASAVEPGLFRPTEWQPFPTEAAAEAALTAGDIQAYYVLPPDYRQTYQAELVYLKDRPDAMLRRQFEALVRANLFSDQPQAQLNRITQGADFVTRTPDGRRQPGWIKLVAQTVAPITAGLIFLIAIYASSDYLMKAVVEEKENRTIEILMTSLPPSKLMLGKVLGVTAVGLTQVVAWFGLPVLGLIVGSSYLPWLQAVRLGPNLLLLLGAIMLPTYIMLAALMTAAGATVSQVSEAQQFAGMFMLPIMAPFWFLGAIVDSPNSPLALALSFFPLTAPLTLTLRLSVTTIPPWQLGLNIAILVLSAGGAIWLAGRALQVGLLRYGPRLRWREFLRRGEV